MFISHIRKVNILVLGQPVLSTGTRLPGELRVFAPDALSQGLAEKKNFLFCCGKKTLNPLVFIEHYCDNKCTIDHVEKSSM